MMMSTILAAAAALADREWKTVKVPGGEVSWSSRLSDPFPEAWPMTADGKMVAYAYARGFDLTGSLRDGELAGPVWARVTLGTSPVLKVLTREISSSGPVGVRPLSADEMSTLKLDAVAALKAPRTAAGDARLRAYYCLQRSLGSVPTLAEREHAAFFKWLACK